MSYYAQNPICSCMRCRMYRMTLPVMMVTFGVLILLDNLDALSGRVFLPVLLIVFGAIRLIQFSAPTEGHHNPGELAAGEIPAVPAQATHPEAEGQVNRG